MSAYSRGTVVRNQILLRIVNGLLVRQGTVLLARRSLQRESYPGLWSFPGEHVEEHETLFEALAREPREEIGVAPTKVVSLGSIRDPNSGPADHVEYHMYIVPAWDGGEPHMVGDEHIELAWLTPQKAIALDDLALKEYRALLKMLPDT